MEDEKEILKKCRKCGKLKPISEFHIDNSKKDNHKNVCKKCLSKKKYYVSKIDGNIKQSIRYCLKFDGKFKWGEVLGYTKKDLIEHLISQFKEGMTIENYGTVWGVSFHIPRRCYIFSTLNDADFRKCWSLKNLKPEFINNCFRQKAVIDLTEVDKYGLYDILPGGNFGESIRGNSLSKISLQKKADELMEQYNKKFNINMLTN